MEYGFIGAIISIILKEYKKEYAIFVSLICGGIILAICIQTIERIILFIRNFSYNLGEYSYFINILLKITGIAIITEIATSICKDSGENAIASKIDFGGKIIIIGISIPIIEKLFEVLISVMP